MTAGMSRSTKILLVAVGFFLPGCFSSNSFDFHKAEKAAQAKQFDEALKYYKRVIQRDPAQPKAIVAAREAARIAYLESRNFLAALEFYRFLVLQSPSSDERKEAQKKIAMIYYEHLVDHKQAIAEFFKFLTLPHTPSEEFESRFNIAKS